MDFPKDPTSSSLISNFGDYNDYGSYEQYWEMEDLEDKRVLEDCDCIVVDADGYLEGEKRGGEEEKVQAESQNRLNKPFSTLIKVLKPYLGKISKIILYSLKSNQESLQHQIDSFFLTKEDHQEDLFMRKFADRRFMRRGFPFKEAFNSAYSQMDHSDQIQAITDRQSLCFELGSIQFKKGIILVFTDREDFLDKEFIETVHTIAGSSDKDIIQQKSIEELTEILKYYKMHCEDNFSMYNLCFQESSSSFGYSHHRNFMNPKTLIRRYKEALRDEK